VGLEEDVRYLVDRQDIVDVLHRWCQFVDSFQLDRLVEETYAKDGIDDHGGGPVQGRDAIRAWYEDSTRNVAAIAHNISNVIVEVDGDRARMRSNVISWTWTMANAEVGPLRNVDYALSLSYLDELTRYPEGWRFDSKVLVSNTSKTDHAHLVALGQLPETQTGIQALARKLPPSVA
jgi:hypothetical protein